MRLRKSGCDTMLLLLIKFGLYNNKINNIIIVKIINKNIEILFINY